MQYLLDLPTAKFIILCVCLLILATIAILGFGGELMALAKGALKRFVGWLLLIPLLFGDHKNEGTHAQ